MDLFLNTFIGIADLLSKGILEKTPSGGHSTHYVLADKCE